MDNDDDLIVCVWLSNELIKQFATKADVTYWIKQQTADRIVVHGHTVKVSETYCSEKLVAYRQVYMMYTSWMPPIFKGICKIHGRSNSVCPFVDQMVGSVFSNAHSACAFILRIHRFSGLLASSL